MIKKVGQRYEVRSRDGKKKLGKYRSKADAKKRLRYIDHKQRTRLAIPEGME